MEIDKLNLNLFQHTFQGIMAEAEKEDWSLVGEYCNKSLRLKADRWNKAVQHSDTRDPVLHFLDGENTEVSVHNGFVNYFCSVDWGE